MKPSEETAATVARRMKSSEQERLLLLLLGVEGSKQDSLEVLCCAEKQCDSSCRRGSNLSHRFSAQHSILTLYWVWRPLVPKVLLTVFREFPKLLGCTVLVLRMAHRIWKETKQETGTAGPGNTLGCCLVSLHFLWTILSLSTVVLDRTFLAP